MSTIRKLKFENNNNTFKIEDTTTTIEIYALDDDKRVVFDKDDKLEIKIKNSSGYLMTIVPDVTDDSKTVNFSSAQLENLPVGYYQFELRVNNNAIFPNEGFLSFEITKNATDITGEVISSITLHDFEEKINQLADNLQARADNGDFDGPKGDKGDPGTNNDPNAVHVSGDQTISGVKNFIDTPTVNGHKVLDDSLQIGGRNLLLDTDTYVTKNNDSLLFYWAIDRKELVGKTLTLSFEIDIDKVKALSGNKRLVMDFTWIQSDGKTHYEDFYKWPEVGDSLHETIAHTFTIPNDIKPEDITNNPIIYNQGVEADSIKVGHPQAVFGNKATDWSPAPEDIGTSQPIMSGNYGLRVTTDGFQKTTDGGATWTTANI